MASKKATPETITVTAACHLNEGGIHYAPGDSLEVTAERADALGESVTLPTPIV